MKYKKLFRQQPRFRREGVITYTKFQRFYILFNELSRRLAGKVDAIFENLPLWVHLEAFLSFISQRISKTFLSKKNFL